MIDSFGEARSLAVSYIGISHKSSGRVADYLSRKEVSEEISGQVVTSLIEDGYIDDMRIARSIISSRKGRKAEGRRSLQQRLYNAGISKDIVSEAFEIMPEDDVSIMELFDARLMPELQKQILQDPFDAELWMNKAFRFLLSRGYSTSLSMDTLRKRIRDVK
ncbi:MAG: RecX family transcriptional regulator [Eubacteriales bacterium]